MSVGERVSRIEGEQAGMSARLDDLRSDMNFRFNLLLGLQIAMLGVGVTLVGIGITILFRLS